MPKSFAAAKQATPLPAVTRNSAREFAQRTLANLEHIRAASVFHADVHVVTQLANSLLGLIVFPFEHNVITPVSSWPLKQWSKNRPTWTIHLDNDPEEKTTTIGRLSYHLRNAIAHRRLRFSTDSPDLSKVTFHAHDARGKKGVPYWRASINGADLLVFCQELALFIDSELS